MQTQLEEKQTLENVPMPFKGLLLLLASVGLFFAYKHFEDAFTKEGDQWVMKPAYEQKVREKIDAPDECEVYYLFALNDGYYECKNCKQGAFYLRQGEIAKIGKTCDEEERYTDSWYEQKGVRYKFVFRGDLTACSKEEMRHLGNYPFLLENKARPDPTEKNKIKGWYKLLYPPMNSGLK